MRALRLARNGSPGMLGGRPCDTLKMSGEAAAAAARELAAVEPAEVAPVAVQGAVVAQEEARGAAWVAQEAAIAQEAAETRAVAARQRPAVRVKGPAVSAA